MRREWERQKNPPFSVRPKTSAFELERLKKWNKKTRVNMPDPKAAAMAAAGDKNGGKRS